MTTYADCAARHGGTAVFWAEISGLQWVFTDGIAYTAIYPTQACDGYTVSRVLMPHLMPLDVVYSRSIEPLQGSGQQGTFSIRVLDFRDDTYPDGFCTWLFGGDRSTIASTRLTANVAHHAGGAGHSWAVSDASVFSAQEQLYCGLETISPSGIDAVDPDNLTGVTRSLWQSANAAHGKDASDTYPLVTNHPTRWLGRVVTLYQSYLDGDGMLANTDGTDNTARAAAFKMRGVIKSISHDGGVWTIACDSVDVLLKRKAMRGTARGEIAPRVVLAGSWNFRDGAFDLANTRVFDIVLSDPTGGTEEHTYNIEVPNGVYSAAELIEAVNVAMPPATLADEDGNLTFVGQLSVDIGSDLLTWTYHTSTVGGPPTEARLCSVKAVQIETAAQGGGWASANAVIWEPLGIGFPETFLIGDEFGDPTTDTDYVSSWPVESTTTQVSLGPHSATTCPLTTREGLATAADFPTNSYVVVSSDQAKAWVAKVVDSTPASNTIALMGVSGQKGVVHVGSPVTVRLAYWHPNTNFGADLPAHGVLRVLLSTGLAAFNHATYDSEVSGIGIEFPHLTPNAGASDTDSLIDVASFERFFSAMALSYDSMKDLLWEGTNVYEWLTAKLAFLGGWLVVRNGQVSVVRGLIPLQSSSEATIDEDSLIEHSNTAGDDRLVVDGVSYECNWDWIGNEAKLEVTTQLGDGSADFGDNTVAFKDKGIRSSPEKLVRLGIDVLGDYSREPWHYKVTCDRVLWRVEPGSVVSFADEGSGDTTDDTRRYQGAPSPEGTRGFSGTTMLVLSSAMDIAGGTTTLELAHVRRKRSGWSAAAWVQSYTNVGNAVLTCDANFFRPSTDGVDVGAFAVGDKVRLLSVNPTQAGAEPGVETGESGLTIASINTTASTITLTGVLAVAWPTPASAASQCYVLVHDSYTTASQTTTAKNWCWMGDSSGDIGDGGDACYEW